MTSVRTDTPPTRSSGVSGWSGRTIVSVIVVVFVLFFAIPLVWLLLATTKSARGLIVDNPFAFGSAGDLATNWTQLFGFQDGAVTTWMTNSALYALGALVITHYQRILNYITPDHVHVFVDGRIVASGGAELAQQLEAEGYEAFIPAGVGGESA